METTFKLVYTIGERDSWRGKDGLAIKSNLAEDTLVECDLPKSLVDHLKEAAVTLEADQLLLSIAEAQKRAIETRYEDLDDMALQAKVISEKTHLTLLDISEDAESKYEQIEAIFSVAQKRFEKHINTTTAEITQSLEQLTEIKKVLIEIDNYSLTKLTATLEQVNKLVKDDPEVLKLVLQHKAN